MTTMTTMTLAVGNIAFLAENERLLEKLRGKGTEVRSFDGWKDAGKWVKKGEKRKAFRVQSGTVSRENPVTGESYADPIYRTAYGFTADQAR